MSDTAFTQLEFDTCSARPIFRSVYPDHSLFYAPGYLVAVKASHTAAFEHDLRVSSPGRWPEVTLLHQHAALAQRRWDDIHTQPFEPVCLTLYLNNECNLHCSYCYAMPSASSTDRLTPDQVDSAAHLVASNCRAQNRSFVAVFHGGGEPTFHLKLADSILDRLEEVADVYGVAMFRYIATNGAISTAKAAWLAKRFDLIGLSCDGPDDIQNHQRPTRGGKPSSTLVGRTAQIIHDAGKPLHIRVTITPYSMNRQTEIAEYICTILKPQEIHVEPVYQIGRASADGYELLHSANEFVSEFLRARTVARKYGIGWSMSASRPGEIHGAYCQIFRQVLHLVPGGAASACFTMTQAEQVIDQGMCVGTMNAEGSFKIDGTNVARLREKLSQEHPQCETCFNRYHCVRACPEYCSLYPTGASLGFRCRVQQTLMQAYLAELAIAARGSHNAGKGVIGMKVEDL